MVWIAANSTQRAMMTRCQHNTPESERYLRCLQHIEQLSPSESAVMTCTTFDSSHLTTVCQSDSCITRPNTRPSTLTIVQDEFHSARPRSLPASPRTKQRQASHTMGRLSVRCRAFLSFTCHFHAVIDSLHVVSCAANFCTITASLGPFMSFLHPRAAIV